MAAHVETLYEGGVPLRVLATDPILRRRSTFVDGTIRLPETAVALELKVLPNAPTPGARYRASLTATAADGATESIGEISRVTADASGYVTLYVNSSALRAGEYVLTLDGKATDAGANANSFRIAVRAEMN
jgi:hypothetical protein